MAQADNLTVDRRRVFCATLLLPVALSGPAIAAVRATTQPMTVYKDPNCGCCTAWAERVRADGRFLPRVVPTADMAAVKQRLGVPIDLGSCHTATVGGVVIEGHVPPADIARLLATRPRGVIGIAAPGMPSGSPGMEVPGRRRDAYDVIAFGPGRARSVFARHS